MSYYEDNLYHSAYSDGYLDGYYAGMELYHSDDSEMTEEERRAKRRRRRRNIALGVGGAAALGVGGYAVGRALRKRGRGIVPTGSRPIGGSSGPIGGSSGPTGPTGPRPSGPRLTGPTLKRVHVPDYDVEAPNGWDFKRNKPKYESDEMNERIKRSYEKMKKKYYDPNTGHWRWRTKSKEAVNGFRRNPGTYRFDPNKDFGGFLTLQQMHRKARQSPYSRNK